jgi:glycosyltransferase involved in cell wall biosynthesis
MTKRIDPTQTLDQSDAPFVGYVVQRFPAIRTTFIRREIEALRAQGVPLKVVSIRRPDVGQISSDAEAMRHLQTTSSLPANPLAWKALSANVGAALQHSATLRQNLCELATADAGRSGWKSRLRLWLQVWRGALLAAHLRHRGRCVHVHAQFADGAATTALACARLLGVPFSFSSHTSYDSPALDVKLAEADFVASISHYDRRRLIELGPPDCGPRIHVIRCGLVPEHWDLQLRASPGVPARILSVGALIEKKGHDVLLRACRILKQRGRAFRLTIIGDGPLRGLLGRMVGLLDLRDRVTLLGSQPQESVRKHLAAADVFALACRQTGDGDSDGVPVSLMEAMACGVPVVSCPVAGVPELVRDRQNGLLVESENPWALAGAMEHALDDLPSRAARIVAARTTIETEFNQDRAGRLLAELLRASLDQAGGPSAEAPSRAVVIPMRPGPEAPLPDPR